MKKTLVVSCFGLLLSVLIAGPASADCMALPPLDESVAASPVVFVGDVVAVDNDGRLARVQVTEIWKGDVPEGTVEVLGGAEGPGMVTSVDRSYRNNTTYLFVLYEGMKGGRFHDNICTATQPYKDRFADLRPASAREVPTGGPLSGDDQGVEFPLAATIGAVALVAILGLMAVRMRARRPLENP